MKNEFIKLELEGKNLKRVELFLDSTNEPIILGHINTSTKTFITKRKKKHVLNILNAFGFNKKLIISYPINNIEVIYGKKIYKTTKQKLVKNGEIHRFDNLDEQIFLPLNQFIETKNAIQNESKIFLQKRKLYY